jgi:hypothetical protein
MNVIFHALAGGAIAHVAFRIATGVRPSGVALGGVAVAAVASHGLLDWLRHEWSGSLYPSCEIRAGSNLVALEAGSNRVASILNHTLVVAAGVVCILFGRSAFARKA